jgi:hypothetical protein
MKDFLTKFSVNGANSTCRSDETVAMKGTTEVAVVVRGFIEMKGRRFVMKEIVCFPYHERSHSKSS